MAQEYGLTTTQATETRVAAGPVREVYLTVDSAATVAPGQVYQYDTSAHNYVNYTSGIATGPYAVCNDDAATIIADTQVRCIVQGDVYLTALDATAEAGADIKAALRQSGIIVVSDARA